MTLVEALAAVLVLFAAAGVIGTVRARIERHGLPVLAWRWLTGMPWHGRALTDAGWVRPGSKALTRSGHATRFHHRPRLHRSGIRLTEALAVLGLAVGLLEDAPVTIRAVIVLAAVTAVMLGVRAVLRWRRRAHRRAWLEPLHAMIAPIVGIPVENAPGSWLQVDRDRRRAVISLPAGWHGSQHERDQLTAAVTAKLGLEQPDVRWQLTGPSHQVTFTASAPPPERVALADVAPAVENAPAGRLVMGRGRKDSVISVSLAGDSPHLGVSMGTGAGKSGLARFLAAQVLRSGGIVLFLDAKHISHPWAWGLPNCAYASEPGDIHDALCWLGAELDRRNKVAKAAADIEGEVHANVGPRLLIVAEELNLTLPRLRRHWADALDGTGKSPAVQALEDVAFAGRQVRAHLLMIGQMLSARASGSGEARENVGVRVMSRYTRNAWRMLCPEHEMPPSPRQPGRVMVVTTTVRECQVPLLTGAQAREMAMGGTVTPLPAGMPGRTAAPAAGAAGELPAPRPVDRPVSLREAAELRVVPLTLHALRTARARDPKFPQPAGLSGSAQVFSAAALIAWYENRSSS